MTVRDRETFSHRSSRVWGLSKTHPTLRAAPSPVHDAVPVQGHEVDLTAAPRAHGCKEHLPNSTCSVSDIPLQLLPAKPSIIPCHSSHTGTSASELFCA